MTFDEWVARINIKADTFEYSRPADDVRRAWRCDGPCGQLMYGIWRLKGWNYPGDQIPAGAYLTEEYKRVCECCWEMFDALKNRRYWKELSANDKKKYTRLKPEGDFFA